MFRKHLFLIFALFMKIQGTFCQIVNTNDSLTVYIFLSEECVISQNYTASMNQLSDEFKSKRIGFVGLFPNTWSKDSTINDFKIKYALKFPLKTDHFKTFTKKFGVSITPEVAVWSHRNNSLVYRGKIDNLYERIGRRRQKATTSELKDVLSAWILNKNILYSETKAVGCFINLKN